MEKVKDRPMVGVGTIIKKDGKVLLGKRTGAHGAGEWSFPGGHLEYREEVFDCAQRETLEEHGIEITNMSRLAYASNFFADEGWHYVTLYVLADLLSGEAEIMEPDKCTELGWFSRDEMPSPLFGTISKFMQTKEWDSVWDA